MKEISFQIQYMQNQQENLPKILEQKILKVNGQVAYKRYERGQFLGKGGFAKCYKGLNQQNKKECAIKIISKALLEKNRSKQKLLSQIRIHRALHHPFIVDFDSVFQDLNYVYIVLELCPNNTLSDMVKKRKKLTVKQTKYFMLQLISAVDYMHSNRVIHRDLKPGNIFLSEDMKMKVGDFGLATKIQFGEQKKRTMCGTPNYIAPEIFTGSVGHSYQVDIWSMGIICYAFLFGRPPFEANQVKLIYQKVKTCKYTFPLITSISEEAKDFIKNILVLDPEKRMTIKEMLAHPFLANQDIPKELPAQALTKIPSFNNQEEKLVRVRSSSKLCAQDFSNKKFEFNLNQLNQNADKIYEGLHSPRNAFNYQQIQGKNIIMQSKDEHRVNILAHVDYSKKYGLGYLLNNQYYGVYFNDETLISCDQSKKNIYFVANPNSKEENIQMFKIDALPKDRDFQKKFILLQRFVTHLNGQIQNMGEQKKKFQKDQVFVYVKQWLKTKHALMFALSNKLFQVNFFDNSQILLHTAKKTVLFTSKKGQKTYEILSNVLQTQQTQMLKRLKYTKQILNSIKRRKNLKVDEIAIVDQ